MAVVVLSLAAILLITFDVVMAGWLLFMVGFVVIDWATDRPWWHNQTHDCWGNHIGMQLTRRLIWKLRGIEFDRQVPASLRGADRERYVVWLAEIRAQDRRREARRKAERKRFGLFRDPRKEPDA